MPEDWKSLTDDALPETAYRAWQALQEEADALIKRLDAAISRADAAIENTRVATEKQRRQQRLMTALTIALVFATVLYTAINVVRTYQTHRGTQVHARTAATEMEQVVATRDANDPKRKLAGASTVDRPRQ